MSKRTNKIKPLLILWIATAMITVGILVFGVASFFSLNQTNTKVFSPPSEEQIALFMQESKIHQSGSADFLELAARFAYGHSSYTLSPGVSFPYSLGISFSS